MKKIVIYMLLMVTILTGCGAAEVKDEVLEPFTQEEVDPDIVEYLDSFEEYIDKYVGVLENYYAMSEDEQLANIGSWSKCLDEYSRNCSTVNEAYRLLDEKGLMSDADKAYWMEVYANCTMKVLEVLDNATESE